MCEKLTCPPDRFRCRNNKCIPRYALCDGIDDCGDKSDEDLRHCENIRRCSLNSFQCGSGHCIDNKLRCDGYSDCLDGTDEENCVKPTCQWGTCSQQCFESKHNTYTCKCSPGFYHGSNDTCRALGQKPPVLVVSSEAELRVMSPDIKSMCVNLLKSI